MDSLNQGEADKIREKRIARLQQRLDNEAKHQQATSSSVNVSTASTDTSTGSEVDGNQPDSKLDIAADQVKKPEDVKLLPKDAQHPTIKHSLEDTTTTRSILQAQGPDDGLTALERWEDRTLSDIFKVTVHSDHAQGFLFLESVKRDLEEQGQNNRMCLAVVDQAILAVASTQTSGTPFSYILSSYRRASLLARNLRITRSEDQYKADVLKEAKRLCASYCEFTLTCPEMFEQNAVEVDLSVELLKDPDDDGFIPMELLQELSTRFDEEELLKSVFLKSLEKLSRSLSELEFLDAYKPYMNSFGRLVSVKSLAILLTQSQSFIPQSVSVEDFEKASLLGPLFRLSPLQPSVTKAYFPNPRTQTVGSMNSGIDSLRIMSRTHQEQLSLIVNSIVRSSEPARLRMLDFFGHAINLNNKRRALQVDEKSVSSDGFLLNINAVLNKLCEPFMDTTYSKVSKIDAKYFRYAPRLDITTETKMNGDQRASDEFYSKKLNGRPNFNSEVFFLNVGAYHVGYIASTQNSESLARTLSDMERHMERLRKEREKHLNSPHLALLDRNLALLETRIQNGLSYKAALDGILSHETIQTEAISFLNYVAVWLLNILSPEHKFPQEQYSLPLLNKPPLEFDFLPEYLVEDISIVFTDIIRSFPSYVTSQQSEHITVFAITFLRMSSYIKNPYLRAKLVEVLYSGIIPSRKYANGVLGEVLNTLAFSLENLMHSLMSFYLEVEHHTNFYQKFNIRYNMAQIIKSIWRNPNYRDKLKLESRHNPEFFVRFVALLLNDVTYLLDESLSKLSEIHRLQHQGEGAIEDADGQSASEPQREQQLASAENQASTYVGLANETVLMVRHFTAAIPDAFVTKELVHRLAGMLNYNLDALVGPKCSNLKVENPQKYRFEPRNLLSEIISIYLNLKDHQIFIDAIAKDGRSYRPELFIRARSILSKYALKSSEDLKSIQILVEKVEGAKRADDEDEAELGDVPDEFLDPLLATIMEEPVILPSSKAVVDLSTIKAHLLSDSKDPFNRAPLKIEDVVPDHALKARIAKFIEERRRGKRDDSMQIDI